MIELRGWVLYAWVGLPTVMYGGYALLGLLNKKDGLTPERRTWFRAGHAHAGVLLLMFLLFIDFLTLTDLSSAVKHTACIIFVVGVLAQAGGFFVHMGEQPEAASIGFRITTVGALLLTVAIAVLVYGIASTA